MKQKLTQEGPENIKKTISLVATYNVIIIRRLIKSPLKLL